MKKLISVIIFCVFMYACSSVPITGRSQLSLVSNQEVLSLSLQQYNDYISSAPKSTNKANTALVTKVGQNIANAVATYFNANGMASELSDYSWEFNLIADSQVNAFCMPGGKIVVYEGILPYTQDETGLAVVIGHEVAHAIAKHANERMSQQVAANYGISAVGGLLSKSPAALQTIGGTVLGLGAQYGVMLPFSRKQESEADHMGLVLMAIAGYDPSKAIPFWERMSQQGTAVPEFMSTHPSDSKRISEIQKELPEAMKYYSGVKSSGTPSSAKTSEQWRF
jgi:predicted Zn-dependent protease